MEKLYRSAKTLEKDFKLITQDLYSNNPGLSANKRVPGSHTKRYKKG